MCALFALPQSGTYKNTNEVSMRALCSVKTSTVDKKCKNLSSTQGLSQSGSRFGPEFSVSMWWAIIISEMTNAIKRRLAAVLLASRQLLPSFLFYQEAGTLSSCPGLKGGLTRTVVCLKSQQTNWLKRFAVRMVLLFPAHQDTELRWCSSVWQGGQQKQLCLGFKTLGNRL